jgi:peptidyl-prolyl cis-trans isomerase D
MLEGLRKHMKAIIWSIAGIFVALIFFGWSMQGAGIKGQKNYAAKVNNKKITYEEFNDLYKTWSEKYRKTYGDSFDDQMSEELRKNLIKGLILNELLYQEASRNGIKISKFELEETIKTLPIFYNEQKQFDPQRYEQAKKVLPKSWWDAQTKEIERTLLSRKLELRIKSMVKVSDEDVRNYFKEKNVLTKINYIDIQHSSFNDVSATDQELKNYYEKNKDAFSKKDQVKTEYLAARKPSEKDLPDSATRSVITNNIKKAMENAFQDLKAGKDLRSTGKKYSFETEETPLFERTWNTENPDFQIFINAAFTLSDPGELTDIVESENYYYVIKLIKRVDAYVPPLEEIKEQIKKLIVSEKREKLAKDKAEDVYSKLMNGEEKNYSGIIKSTPLFKIEDEIPGLKKENQIKGDILKIEAGKWSKPLQITNGYCLIKVTERKMPAGILGEKEFSELKNELMQLRQYLVVQEWYKNLQDKSKIENALFPEKKEAAEEEK